MKIISVQRMATFFRCIIITVSLLLLLCISTTVGQTSPNTNNNNNTGTYSSLPRGWYPQIFDDPSKSFPLPVVEGAASTIDNSTNTIYMFGGYSYYSRNDLYKFSPLYPSMTTISSSSSMVTPTGSSTADSATNYVPKGSWSRLHDMQLPTIINVNNGIVTSIPGITIPGPRTRSCLQYHQATTGAEPMLWLYGGRYYGSGDREQYDYNDVWMYTISSGVWSSIVGSALRTGRNGVPSLPVARSACACVVRGNSLIIYGGITRNRDLLGDLWAFHTLSRTWAEVTESIMWPKRSNFNTLINSNIFFREDPLATYGSSAIYLPDYDAMVLHGGRSVGVNGMVPNSYVVPDTHIFIFGDKYSNSTGWSGVTGRWITVPIRGYAPPRAAANPFSWSNQFCTIGGTDYVGSYGDRLVDSIHCLELSPLFTLLGLIVRSSPFTYTNPTNTIAGGLQIGNASNIILQDAWATWRELSEDFLGNYRPMYRERAIGGIILPKMNLLFYGTGVNYDTLLNDVWLLPIPSMDILGAWIISQSPQSEGDTLLTSYLAYAGTLIILMSIIILVFARRLRKRQQEMEDAEAAETVVDIIPEPGVPVIPPGQTENGGVDPTIVANLKTIRYVKHIDDSPPKMDKLPDAPDNFLFLMKNSKVSSPIDTAKVPDDIVSVVAGVILTEADSDLQIEKGESHTSSVVDSHLPNISIAVSDYNAQSTFDLGTETSVFSTSSVLLEDNHLETTLHQAQDTFVLRNFEKMDPSSIITKGKHLEPPSSLNVYPPPPIPYNDPFDHDFHSVNEVHNSIPMSLDTNPVSDIPFSIRTGTNNGPAVRKLLPPPPLERTTSTTAIRSQRSNRRHISFSSNSSSVFSSNSPSVITDEERILDIHGSSSTPNNFSLPHNHPQTNQSTSSVFDEQSVTQYTEPEYDDNESLILADQQNMMNSTDNDANSSILTNYAVKSFTRQQLPHNQPQESTTTMNNNNNGNNNVWWLPLNSNLSNISSSNHPSSYPMIPFMPPMVPLSNGTYSTMNSSHSHPLSTVPYPLSVSVRMDIDHNAAPLNNKHHNPKRKTNEFISEYNHPIDHQPQQPRLILPSSVSVSKKISENNNIVPSEPVLPSFPTITSSSPSVSSTPSFDPQTLCSICLGEYEDGNELLVLPCKHIYHTACISKWLINHVTCPLCKDNVVLSVSTSSTIAPSTHQTKRSED